MGVVRVGFCGTGGIAHSHVIRLLDEKEASIVALADPSEQNRANIAKRFQLENARQFEDLGAMLEHGDVDAVVICSPHTLHYEQASAVLAAGKHVLIEKPMTCSSEEAEKLIELANLAGKKLQVSYQRHFMPQFQYIRKVITSGQIGRLTSVTASLYQDWRDAQKGTWRQNPGLSGGGMLMDSGSHIIDVLLWTTELTPQSVAVQLEQHGAPVEIDTFSAIRFAEGAVGSLNIVGLAPRNSFTESYVFVGENGGLYYNDGQIVLHRNGHSPEKAELPLEESNPDRSFIGAILGRHEVEVPGQFALKVVKFTEMIYNAAGYSPIPRQ